MAAGPSTGGLWVGSYVKICTISGWTSAVSLRLHRQPHAKVPRRGWKAARRAAVFRLSRRQMA